MGVHMQFKQITDALKEYDHSTIIGSSIFKSDSEEIVILRKIDKELRENQKLKPQDPIPKEYEASIKSIFKALKARSKSDPSISKSKGYKTIQTLRKHVSLSEVTDKYNDLQLRIRDIVDFDKAEREKIWGDNTSIYNLEQDKIDAAYLRDLKKPPKFDVHRNYYYMSTYNTYATVMTYTFSFDVTRNLFKAMQDLNEIQIMAQSKKRKYGNIEEYIDDKKIKEAWKQIIPNLTFNMEDLYKTLLHVMTHDPVVRTPSNVAAKPDISSSVLEVVSNMNSWLSTFDESQVPDSVKSDYQKFKATVDSAEKLVSSYLESVLEEKQKPTI